MNTQSILTQTGKNTYEGETLTMRREEWSFIGPVWVLRENDKPNGAALGADDYAVNLADLFNLVLVHDWAVE